MIAAESIEIIARTVNKLRQEDPDYDKHPAVLAVPGWWVQKIKEAHGAGGTDLEIDSVEGCEVLVKEETAEPLLIAADGRTWPVVPAWLRSRPATPIEGVGDGLGH